MEVHLARAKTARRANNFIAYKRNPKIDGQSSGQNEGRENTEVTFLSSQANLAARRNPTLSVSIKYVVTVPGAKKWAIGVKRTIRLDFSVVKKKIINYSYPWL
jgi:hypothetical protein